MPNPPIKHNVNVIYAVRLLYPAVTTLHTEIYHINSHTFHLYISLSAINNVSSSINIVKKKKNKK
jgi:hypothetical protein